MHEIAQITDQDVILGYTPLLASDAVGNTSTGGTSSTNIGKFRPTSST
jgi:hypothetical protein